MVRGSCARGTAAALAVASPLGRGSLVRPQHWSGVQARRVCVPWLAATVLSPTRALAAAGTRHFSSTTTSTGPVEPEVIALDSVEVEIMPDHSDGAWQVRYESHAATAAETTTAAHAPHTACTSSAAQPMVERWHHELRHARYWDVVHVDPFARSRITNFVRRAGSASARVFDVREEVMPNGARVHVASCRLPLPEPHRSYVAEGIAQSAKDAELLAAMHAERVCDALGVPLFRLPSMQRRHAATARAGGRYAPMPGDPVRPAGTLVPPPLRMLSGHGSGEAQSGGGGGGSDLGEGGRPHAPGDRHSTGTAGSSQGRRDGTAAGPRNEVHGSSSTTSPEPVTRTPLFASTIAEAVVVASSASGLPHTIAHAGGEDRPGASSHGSSSGGGSASLFADPSTTAATHTAGAASLDGAPVMDPASYAASVWFPWTDARRGALPSPPHGGGGGGGQLMSPPTVTLGPPAVAVEGALFDPTEGGLWEMVNTISTRCSPTPQDALVLPCVFEPAALERVKDYFLQHGLHMADRTTTSTVAVPGSPTRMYVVELQLVTPGSPAGGGGVVMAKGKAQTRDTATHLAAMHAELLLDALGWPLFPTDAARQSRHARAVAGYGRWAPEPAAGHVTPPTAHAALPRPLKQQVGGDEVWLDPTPTRRAHGHPRSDGERMITAMNELNALCGDFVEVHPPVEWLAESVELLRQWQTTVARSPYPELYVITGMGDYFRATTLTPVPHPLGVRGGNAVGRTVEQAVQLCALHAVDGLCALGIPVLADPRAQARYEWRRRQCGRVTAADMRGMTRPKGLVSVLKPSMTLANGKGKAEAGEDAEATCTHTYLPGYLIEGAARRLPPHIDDTLKILQLSIPQDFAVCGGGGRGWASATSTPAPATASTTSAAAAAAAEVLQTVGNDTKTCVQNYMRHQHEVRRQRQQLAPAPQDAPGLEEGSGGTTSSAAGAAGVHDDQGPVCPQERAELQRWLADWPAKITPDVYMTGYGKQVSVHNIAYMRVPPPLGAVTAPPPPKPRSHTGAEGESTPADPPVTPDDAPSLLAIGISLKKKDAERACYVHAAALLMHHYAEDVVQNYRAGLPRQGSIASFAEVRAKLLPPEDGTATGPGAAPPKPLMNFVMREFLESGRHFTAPRKRPIPGPYNPF